MIAQRKLDIMNFVFAHPSRVDLNDGFGHVALRRVRLDTCQIARGSVVLVHLQSGTAHGGSRHCIFRPMGSVTRGESFFNSPSLVTRVAAQTWSRLSTHLDSRSGVEHMIIRHEGTAVIVHGKLDTRCLAIRQLFNRPARVVQRPIRLKGHRRIRTTDLDILFSVFRQGSSRPIGSLTSAWSTSVSTIDVRRCCTSVGSSFDRHGIVQQLSGQERLRRKQPGTRPQFARQRLDRFVQSKLRRAWIGQRASRWKTAVDSSDRSRAYRGTARSQTTSRTTESGTAIYACKGIVLFA